MPQVGPITMWDISTTLTPASGNSVPAIGFSLFSPGSLSGSVGCRHRSEKYYLLNDLFVAPECSGTLVERACDLYLSRVFLTPGEV